MKTHFPHYYRVQREHLIKQFGELVFVMDASALLDIFRLDKSTTQDVFAVLHRYAEQIVIPYHAAKEYNNRIHSVLLEQLHNIDNAQKSFDAFCQLLEAKHNQPYISLSSAKKLQTLKNSISSDFKTQRDYLWEQLIHGDLQNQLSELMDGKVLPPFSDEEIQQIKEEGEGRYKQKVPPGWKDGSKGENEYGDLINWKEILRYAKTHQKSIVFVSNDQKEDWICQHEGRTVCPDYKLLKEFYETVNNKELLFHIYTLDRFLDFVREQDTTVVSENTIEQVRDVILDGRMFDNLNFSYNGIQAALDTIREHNEKINSMTITGFESYSKLISALSSLRGEKEQVAEMDIEDARNSEEVKETEDEKSEQEQSECSDKDNEINLDKNV